jgi:hypothetical protein
MGPRPSGRGDATPRGVQDVTGVEPQWGHGRTAMETGRADRPSGRRAEGATMGPPPSSRGDTDLLIRFRGVGWPQWGHGGTWRHGGGGGGAAAVRGHLAAMGPRRSRRGDHHRLRPVWADPGAARGHGRRAVETCQQVSAVRSILPPQRGTAVGPWRLAIDITAIGDGDVQPQWRHVPRVGETAGTSYERPCHSRRCNGATAIGP